MLSKKTLQYYFFHFSVLFHVVKELRTFKPAAIVGTCDMNIHGRDNQCTAIQGDIVAPKYASEAQFTRLLETT